MNESEKKITIAFPPLKPDQVAYLADLRKACMPLQPGDPRLDEPFCNHEQCRRKKDE